jgi:hypothetical protein
MNLSACRSITVAARWIPAAAAALGLALSASVASADEAPNLLTDAFDISLGTFMLNSDTNIRLDGTAGQSGTEFNWEQKFGDENATRFRVDGSWRFTDSGKHKLRFLWFNFSRDASRTNDKEIIWNGETIPVSSKIDASFSFDIIELAYEYAFLKRDTYEVTGSIGLHYADFSAGLAATVSTPGGTGTKQVGGEASVGAPLPVIGLRGIWQLPHNFWIDASAQYFALSIEGYDGNLQDYRVGVRWQPSRWVGLGVGYNQFGINVDVDKEKFNGSLDWKYKGPQIYYSIAF